MKISSAQEKAFAALLQRLEGVTSLDQLREIEQEASLQTAEKVGGFGERFFERLSEVKQTFVEQEARRLREKGDVISQIAAARLEMSYVEPSATKREISRLADAVEMEPSPAVQRAFEDLQLAFERPIVQELEPNGLFAVFSRAIGEQCVQKESLDPAKHFSAVQLDQIRRGA